MANISSTCLFPPPTPGPSYSTGPWLQDGTYDEFDLNDVAEACSAHIELLIPTTSLDDEPPKAKAAEPSVPPLRDFVSYALRRTRLPPAVAFSAVALVRRFKRYYPDAAAAPDSRHRLFLAAYILSSKLLQDNPFEQKAWRIVSGNAFSAADIRKMERELCRFLGWNLNVARTEIDELVLDHLAPWLFAPSPAAPTLAASTSSSPEVNSESGAHWSSSDEGHYSSSSEASTCSTANTSPAFSSHCHSTWSSPTSPSHHPHHPSPPRQAPSSYHRRASSSSSAVAAATQAQAEKVYHYLPPPPRSASETALQSTTTAAEGRRYALRR